VKISLVAQHYAPHFEGGSEAVVRAQARELAALGHELRIVAGTDLPHAGEDAPRCRVDGLEVVHLPRFPHERYDLELARARLRELVLRETAAAELVHVHHWSTLCGDLVRALAARQPVVVSLHDFFASCPRFFRATPPAELECPPRGEFETCARCIERDAHGHTRAQLEHALRARTQAYAAELRAARACLAPSSFLARALEDLLGLENGSVRVLGNGLAPGLARTAAPLPYGGWTVAPRGHARRALRVLHFGHRSHVKGTLDLVRALAALPAGSAELWLAGSEVESGFDARLRSAAGELALRFLGPYARETLPELAAGADLAAFPSQAQESYGLVVDEALALGLPTWVSERGALPERIGAARGASGSSGMPGRVLPASNVEAWTAAFARVLAHPLELEHERARVPASLPDSAEVARALDKLYAELRG
jgi:glycosyltransferase involved in cell wall biosynthesis